MEKSVSVTVTALGVVVVTVDCTVEVRLSVSSWVLTLLLSTI